MLLDLDAKCSCDILRASFKSDKVMCGVCYDAGLKVSLEAAGFIEVHPDTYQSFMTANVGAVKLHSVNRVMAPYWAERMRRNLFRVHDCIKLLRRCNDDLAFRNTVLTIVDLSGEEAPVRVQELLDAERGQPA